ncbi:hypothetical protein MCOR25_010954 [Pyricularia grisea]|nr:hypothetical protein MCOR25_010954 [Pyricularia grisea]
MPLGVPVVPLVKRMAAASPGAETFCELLLLSVLSCRRCWNVLNNENSSDFWRGRRQPAHGLGTNVGTVNQDKIDFGEGAGLGQARRA